jgi:acetoin utilization deacetylase AcuC-like enzyme
MICVNLGFHFQMKTALIHHPIYEKHDTGPGHPEMPERYRVVIDALHADQNLMSRLSEITPEKAPRGIVQAAHTKEHFKRVEAAFAEGLDRLDMDTDDLDGILRCVVVCGGRCDGGGRRSNAGRRLKMRLLRFAHPAITQLRNVRWAFVYSIMSLSPLATRRNKYKEIERVAIVDWDVIMAMERREFSIQTASVFFFSMHQYPWYPGPVLAAKRVRERVWVLRKHTSSCITNPRRPEVGVRICDRRDRFKNEAWTFIFISAGFDAHKTDPLGQLQLEDPDYRSMTRTVMEWRIKLVADVSSLASRADTTSIRLVKPCAHTSKRFHRR